MTAANQKYPASAAVASGWRLDELTAWRGYSFEWAEGGKLLVTCRRDVCEADDCFATPHRLAALPMPWWQAAAASLRPIQRLLRLMFYNLVPVKNGTFLVSFGKRVAVIENGEFHAVSGIRRACRILRGACADADDGGLFFGEYVNNPARDEIFIYRLDALARRSEVAYAFPPRSIRHVHGVYRDPYTSELWCLTGDRPHECQMLRTRDGFSTLDVVGAGDESWRAVSVQFTKDAVFYGSDAEFAQNYLYRIDRCTGRRDVLAPIGGPVYYSCRSGGEMYFAVTAEMCPSQTDRCASLWRVGEDGGTERILQMTKDHWNKKYFMPGTLHFPSGPGLDDRVLFHAVGLARADNRTFSLRRAA
jgi:hypothetical protein